MPVDCDVAGGRWPVEGDREGLIDQPGRGISHFATCPQAAQWRQR